MKTIAKYVNAGINPNYVQHLEAQLAKIQSAICLIDYWLNKDASGKHPEKVYMACIKDIQRHLE